MSFEFKDAKDYELLWNSGGPLNIEGGGRFNLSDALASPNAPVMFPKVISNIVREAQEPLLVGTSLLQRINFSYGASIITFPSVGALVAADIAEGMEYPEVSLDGGGATVTAKIGKSGLAVKVTEEMIRYSQFDVIGMHLRAAGRALARHKETKIFNMIKSMGVTAFDNVQPGLSMKGITTGRSLDGTGNGSVTMDDIFDAWAQVVMQGYIPNTMLVHPLTWTMFMKDATMRHFILTAGGGNMLPQMWSGNPQNYVQQWASASQNGLGVSAGQSHVPAGGSAGGTAASGSGSADNNPQLNTQFKMPSYFGMAGSFRVIVSPFMPFDPQQRLTDIFLFDSNNLGVLVVDEEVTTEEFNDPKVDIKKIKLRERYALGILNEGHAIAVLRNVHVVPNEIVLPATASIDVAGSIAPLGPTDNVLG